MGLYIKGMEMPKDDVHAFKQITITNNWIDGEIIMLAHDTITNEFIGEVVEVPEPHGRLVDADFEEKHYAIMTINPTPDVTPQEHVHSAYTVKAFRMAKTVIEAEGDDYDYERTSDMRDYCEMYEPTYNPEDGSM